MANRFEKALVAHKEQAKESYDLFVDMTGQPMRRVPGMDTVIRLAWRIECGRSILEAAKMEYLYRWNLALKSSIFGVPHSIGL